MQADSLFSVLQPFWGFTRERELHGLFDQLWGYAIRDQGTEADDSALTLLERRHVAHTCAVEMVRQSQQAAAAIRAVRDCFEQFHCVVDWSPQLLESVLETDIANPQDITLPPNLLILMAFEGRLNWEDAEAALQELSQLPVRRRFAPGVMPNMTLQRAVRACRQYWRDVEGRDWGMYSLKDRNVRDGNNVEELAGPAEVFAADMLRYVGIRFGLHDLCSAWTAVDRVEKAERKRNCGEQSRRSLGD